MKFKLSLFMMIASINILAQNVNDIIVVDTIDYESTRMYIEVPRLSRSLSNTIVDEEGFWVCFPFMEDSCVNGLLIVDYSVMNRNYLTDTENYDVELWNTFNRNSVGSRCFIKDGLFYRIDRYEDGLQVFYTDVKVNVVDVANRTMQSIYKTPSTATDPPVTINRRNSKNETSLGP